MADLQVEEPGIKIKGQKYPIIPLDDYHNADWRIVRRLLYPLPLAEFFKSKIDLMLYKNCLAGVAVRHARDMSVDDILEMVDELRAADVELVGVKIVEVEDGDSDPPSNGDGEVVTPSDSGESTERSSELSQDPSPITDSGIQDSPTGSEE